MNRYGDSGSPCLVPRSSLKYQLTSHYSLHSSESHSKTFCSDRFDTMHAVCIDLLCVVCIGLLSAEFSTVNAGLGRPMLWKPLCLLSTPESLATTLCQLT